MQDDPDLFERIAESLIKVKEPKKDKKRGRKEERNRNNGANHVAETEAEIPLQNVVGNDLL